ncbi:MAG TPA: HipA N-terminal domain-containing protein [Chthonomonadaceae bacterium]|nr:HipA N-terminal domain-containing protein [Chthonomonadaceae bacterium]
MARTLDVYLHRHFVGNLIQDDHGEMVFDYAETWVNDPNAIPLSQSLPLRKKRRPVSASRW